MMKQSTQTNAKDYYRQGDTYYDKGEYAKAIECFNEAIKLDSSYANAYVLKGLALSALGKNEDAINCYDKAISINPNATIYNNKGLALSALGKMEDAINCFDKAIALNPNYASAYNGKGNALSVLGKQEDATNCYDKAISINPNNASVYYNKGVSLSALGKQEDAIKCYDKATVLNPNYNDAYYGKGIALSALGKKEDAIKCYDKEIALNPKHINAYNNKGNALSALGKKEDAINCYDKAISINPNYALYYCNKGKILNELGKEAEALACFNKAYEISKVGNLGSNLSTGNITFINETISKDREELLKKLTEIQKLTTEVDSQVSKLDQNNPTVKKVVDQFKSLKQRNTELTSKAIDSLDTTKASKDLITNHDSNLLLLQQMNEMRAQMQQFYMDLKQGQAGINSNINTGFTEVKEEQKKQTKELKKYGKQLEANSEAIKQMQQATLDMKAKIASDSKATEKDKQIMESKINAITEKMQGLAKQEDVEAITQEMTKLMSESKITKGRLADLEDDIDNIIERQDKTDERLQKLEMFQQTVEEMKAKIASDIKASEKDKQIMESKLNAIADKMQSLAKQEDVEAITQEMTKLMSESKITKGRLADLEDDIDSLIEKTESLTVKVVGGIEYDNPLLNHPTLFKTAEQHYGLNKTFDLSHSLSIELIDEAIHNNDSELLLAGMFSLHLNNSH